MPARRFDDIVDRLGAAGCVAAEEEALELTDAAADDAALELMVRRRERGEPLAWVTGTAMFCGRRVLVDPGVYVPRPQSEELARRAADVLAAHAIDGTARAADLCTGSGAIALHLAHRVPDAVVVGVDSDWRAARCARRNGVATVLGDLGAGLCPRAFDVVTAIAPYVPTGAVTYLPSDVQRYEPHGALDGGPDGLTVVRRAVEAAGTLLRRGGFLFAEIGGTQADGLAPVLETCGFGPAVTWADEDGDLRGLAARRAG